MYELDNYNMSAFVSIILGLFYSYNEEEFLWRNYANNDVIYLQEYILGEIFSRIKKSKVITTKHVKYLVSILTNQDCPLKMRNLYISIPNNIEVVRDIYVYMAKLFNFKQLSESNFYIPLLFNEVVDDDNDNDNENKNDYARHNFVSTLDELHKWERTFGVNMSEYIIFYINRNDLISNNTKINPQKKISNEKAVWAFRAVVCYSKKRKYFYVVIKVLESYYIFDFVNANKEGQFYKINIKSMEDLIKLECIMIMYKIM